MKPLNFKTEARRCEAAAPSRFSSSSKLAMPISETIGIGRQAATAADAANPQLHQKACPNHVNKIPRTFHDSHAFWRGFWYCKSARGRSPMDAERATSGFKWNWYMHHHRTTPMSVPSWLFDHHKHSSLNSMHGNNGSGSRACGWGWSARHDGLVQAKTSAHGAKNFDERNENIRASAAGKAASAQYDIGPGFATVIPNPHFAAGSVRGHQMNAHGGNQPAERSFGASSPSRNDIRTGYEQSASGLNAQSVPLDGASSRYDQADGPRSSRGGRYPSGMASYSLNGSSFIFVIGGASGNATTQRSHGDGNVYGVSGYSDSANQQGAMTGFASGTGFASASGFRKSGYGASSSVFHGHLIANPDSAAGDAGNAAGRDRAASDFDGYRAHDRNGKMGATAMHGQTGIAKSRFRLIKGSSLISNGYVRKTVHLKVTQDSVNPE